ncbi:MAG: outer membrane protein assembly factor BamD [bacterium]
MRNLIFILLIFTTLSSCSEFQKTLRSDDLVAKFKMGASLFEEGKYSKANKLFIQIVPKYRGKPQAQRLMYMYSKSFYELGDYYTANYQFERFISAYPESDKLEESAFLAAKSYYYLSPRYSKEQKETIEALEKLQRFINVYPESEYVTEANTLVKELDLKLERKAYEIALQYNETVPYTADYNAAIAAFDKFLLEYPGSVYREDALYHRFESAYGLAINSVEWKKEERLKKASEYLASLKKAYPETKYGDETEKMLKNINEQLENYNTESK